MIGTSSRVVHSLAWAHLADPLRRRFCGATPVKPIQHSRRAEAAVRRDRWDRIGLGIRLAYNAN